MRGSRGSLVQVVHRQPLSRTSAVAVVTIGDRVLVLGTTEQNVSLITELDPEALVDADLIALPGSEPEDGDRDTSIDGLPLTGRVVSAGERVETQAHRAARHRAAETSGALGGSILSPETWRQAVAALGRRAS